MIERQHAGRDASLSELFEILSHKHRRHVLWVLAHPDTRTDATISATRFTDTGDEPDVLQLALRHNHLPKLDDHGLVDWDPEAETLARGPRFDEVEPFLSLMDDNEEEIPQDWP